MSDENSDTPLVVALKGLLSGMGGALALSAMVRSGKAVMEAREPGTDPHSEGISAGEALSESPSASGHR